MTGHVDTTHLNRRDGKHTKEKQDRLSVGLKFWRFLLVTEID